MKTVILSDCHIGSSESNHRLVNRLLSRLECDRLVLLGDFWDLWDMDASDLRAKYGDIIWLLRMLSGKGVKVDLVLGNHDEDYLDDPVVPLSEINIMKKAEILLPDGRKVGLCHGHQFDPLFKKWYRWSRFLAWLNKNARKILGVSAKTFKKTTCTDLKGSKYSEAVEKIHDKAKNKYKKRGYDCLIMGHTHWPTCDPLGPGFMGLVNAGDWKWSNTYVVIEGNKIELRHFCKCKDERQCTYL